MPRAQCANGAEALKAEMWRGIARMTTWTYVAKQLQQTNEIKVSAGTIATWSKNSVLNPLCLLYAN